MPPTEPLDQLLAAAAAHGRISEPDHEVGDLQDFLRSCWRRLPADSQRAVYEEHVDVLAWLDEEVLTPPTACPVSWVGPAVRTPTPPPALRCSRNPPSA
jgi:hypothetical protein